MTLTVAHFLERFRAETERPIFDEIAAVEREGIRSRIIAFRSEPPTVAEQRGQAPFPNGRKRGQSPSGVEASETGELPVSYLDVMQGAGRRISVAATMGAGVLSGLKTADLRHRLRLSDIGRRARLRQILRRLRPDVLHAQFGHLGLLALPAARSEQLPLVVSFRGRDVMLIGRVPSAARNELFSYAARILVRSEYMRRELLAMGCPEEKAAVQPTGIPVAAIPFLERTWPGSDDKVVILSVGRLTPKKGMDLAVRALARCRPGPVLRIIGDGPERAALVKLSQDLGIAHRVAFSIGVSREQAIAEMLQAHLFLLACRTAPDGEKEGVPNALKEAQATGLPALSTSHAGIPECVEHGVTGLLSPEGDADALARNIEELLSHPERWAAMGRRGRERMERRYGLVRLAPELARHYHSIAAGESGAPAAANEP